MYMYINVNGHICITAEYVNRSSPYAAVAKSDNRDDKIFPRNFTRMELINS